LPFFIFAAQVGNKRLKVQHKQIRQKDMLDRDSQSSYGVPPGDGSYQRPPQFPSGPMPSAAGQNLWYDEGQPDSSNVEGVSDGGGGPNPDEGIERASTSSTGVETPHGMGVNEAGPNPDALSPLSNLDSLQNALPDVPGSAQPE
jgi:hypothetical protein